MATLIGIDIGTSGAKTALYDETGRCLASYTAEYPLHQPQNGWAEQDPADWWRAVKEGLSHVSSFLHGEPLSGIGLSGQMHGLVLLDKDGKVLRKSILWCDQRTGDECADIEQRVGGRARLIELTANPALTGFTASKIMWVKKHEPALYDRCSHILLPKDYIRYLLTGEFATEVSDASGMQLLDVGHRRWSKEVLEKLEIDGGLLAKVYESAEITGTLLPSVAKEVGLPAGIPVAGGAGDNAAAAVGTGTVEDGDAFVTIGTSGVVYAHSSRVVIDKKGRVHTFCSAVPGQWHVMGVTQAAGLSLKWFVENFCAEESQRAVEAGVDRYAVTDDEAAQVPIGANGLLYLPYLMGERTPHLDPECRGVFFGLSGMHRRRDLIRAVMEGVAYSLADCASVIEEMGVSIGGLNACGGGGKSALWRQMLADVFGRPIHQLETKEGASLGAAILGGVAAGVYPTVQEACRALITVRRTAEPNEAASKAYAPYYALYRSLYPALKDRYRALSSLR